MTREEIEALAAQLAGSGLAEIQVERDGASLRMRLSRQPLAMQRAHLKAPVPNPVKAPEFGYFRKAHPQRDAPQVRDGDRVEAGQVLGFIEVENHLLPVAAPRAGSIGGPLVEDGALVGYGAALFTLR